MGHYAKVVKGKVVDVIVADSDFFDTFVDTSPGTWIQTSYNTQGGVHSGGGTPLRKNFAGIGDNYNDSDDAFYAPQPFNSWNLNQTTFQWEAPVAHPGGNGLFWNEDTLSWDSA